MIYDITGIILFIFMVIIVVAVAFNGEIKWML